LILLVGRASIFCSHLKIENRTICAFVNRILYETGR
jgi:hypothetical protein